MTLLKRSGSFTTQKSPENKLGTYKSGLLVNNKPAGASFTETKSIEGGSFFLNDQEANPEEDDDDMIEFDMKGQVKKPKHSMFNMVEKPKYNNNRLSKRSNRATNQLELLQSAITRFVVLPPSIMSYSDLT